MKGGPFPASATAEGHSLTCPLPPPGGKGSKAQAGEEKIENCVALAGRTRKQESNTHQGRFVTRRATYHLSP